MHVLVCIRCYLVSWVNNVEVPESLLSSLLAEIKSEGGCDLDPAPGALTQANTHAEVSGQDRATH